MAFQKVSATQGGDVAQLIERWTGTWLRKVQFPVVASNFSLIQLSVRNL